MNWIEKIKRAFRMEQDTPIDPTLPEEYGDYGPIEERDIRQTDFEVSTDRDRPVKKNRGRIPPSLCIAMGLVAMFAIGCSDADVASENLSKAADQFQIPRRIVFYNGITDKYLLTIEGYCSLGNFDAERELTVTCKTGPGLFKKNFLGLSDNVTYFVEQLEPANVSVDHYKVIFKPSVVVPDIDVE
jgi:hypothetical protein